MQTCLSKKNTRSSGPQGTCKSQENSDFCQRVIKANLCKHVCVYVSLCLCVFKCVCECLWTCMCLDVSVCIWTCMCLNVSVCIWTRMCLKCVCVYLWTRTCLDMSLCLCVFVNKHVFRCVCEHSRVEKSVSSPLKLVLWANSTLNTDAFPLRNWVEIQRCSLFS